MDARQRGITIRGKSTQIAFTYQGVRCRETIPIPPTKAAQKELALKLQSIRYEIKIGTFDYLKHFPFSKKAKELRKTRPDCFTIGEGLKAGYSVTKADFRQVRYKTITAPSSTI